MSIFIGFLTVFLVLDCAFLVLLVLLQLPKKEAGAGTAFGGGATDVLFGAGTGNVLTKTTGYAAAVFLGLCLLLAILQNQHHRGSSDRLKDELSRGDAPAAAATALPTTSTPANPAAGPMVEVPTLATPPAPTDPAGATEDSKAATPAPAKDDGKK
jgi:preprotein translocase subunit SecG